jgi:putative heme degradation protein
MSNVQKMVTATSDPPGDLCAHARSVIIQAVSQLDLENFLANFNHVIETSVMRKDDESGETADKFYDERGLTVHNVEVRSVSCKDKATQAVLQDIIKEHTNRIARMQKQESENEVNVKMLEGQIASEEMRLKLLDIKLEVTFLYPYPLPLPLPRP